jgi:hypothetical protein
LTTPASGILTIDAFGAGNYRGISEIPGWASYYSKGCYVNLHVILKSVAPFLLIGRLRRSSQTIISRKKIMKVKIATVLGMGVLAVSSAKAAVLFDQPSDGIGSWASQNDTTAGGFGNFATCYSDFTLGSASSINKVDWTGSYFNPPSQGTITAFTLDFYSNNSGQAGTLLSSEVISGTAGETADGNDSYGEPQFTYSAALPTSFSAAGGAKYWLSIVPDMAFPPQWGWGTSGTGDGSGYQDFFGTPSTVGNFALTLEGTSSVPDGGTTSMLLGVALAGLGFAKRKIC